MHDPVVPGASEEAKRLLKSLYAISGSKTLSGQHNAPANISKYSDEAFELSGQYPAIWGQDFGFSDDDWDGIQFRDAVIEEAIRQHASGSVITLMWHAVRPIEEEPGTFKDSVCGPFSMDEWNSLFDHGSEIHARWRRQVAVVAKGLQQLQSMRIPVLWRPYHEMNGDWFWWCNRPGPDGYVQLWRMLFHELTEVHGLRNLIWVWNANAPRLQVQPYADFYPGHDVVDILATDVYHNDYRQSHYDELVALAEGRPVALGEVGHIPTPGILEAQPGWCWFMTWCRFLREKNSMESIQAVYGNPRVVNRPLAAVLTSTEAVGCSA